MNIFHFWPKNGAQRNKACHTGATLHNVEQFYEHNNYIHGTSFSYDFNILKLKEEITFGPKAQPICLPQPDVESKFTAGVFDTTEFTQSGWGLTEDVQKSSYLKDISLNFIPDDICSSKLAAKIQIDQTTICAGKPGKIVGGSYEGTCLGDSGGKYELSAFQIISDSR